MAQISDRLVSATVDRAAAQRESCLEEAVVGSHNGQPIRLSPEEKKRLAKNRKGIDPNWQKAIETIDIEDD